MNQKVVHILHFLHGFGVQVAVGTAGWQYLLAGHHRRADATCALAVALLGIYGLDHWTDAAKGDQRAHCEPFRRFPRLTMCWLLGCLGLAALLALRLPTAWQWQGIGLAILTGGYLWWRYVGAPALIGLKETVIAFAWAWGVSMGLLVRDGYVQELILTGQMLLLAAANLVLLALLDQQSLRTDPQGLARLPAPRLLMLLLCLLPANLLLAAVQWHQGHLPGQPSIIAVCLCYAWITCQRRRWATPHRVGIPDLCLTWCWGEILF